MRLSPSRSSLVAVCGVVALALEKSAKDFQLWVGGEICLPPLQPGHSAQSTRKKPGCWEQSSADLCAALAKRGDDGLSKRLWDRSWCGLSPDHSSCLCPKQSSSQPGSPAAPSPSQMDLEQQQHTSLFGTPPPPLPVPSVPMKEPPGYEEAMKQQPKAQVRAILLSGFLGEQVKSCHCKSA